MDGCRNVIFEDAIYSAIKAEKKNIVYRRIIAFLFALCFGLSFALLGVLIYG